MSGGGYDALPEQLGPDSLTWKYFGQWTGMLQGSWAGSMQNMHPQLGAAVKDHSIFFMERMPRLYRSVYPIGGVVFDGDRAPQTGAEVRDYHIGIKGVDEQGRRYTALNPDVFYWAHATFFKSVLLAAERFRGGLTEDQKRQLFDEHVTWYRMYGMSMRPVPKTWDLVHLVTTLTPKRMMMHPRKRSAFDRASGRIPSDAPLAETPARNLPPVEHRNDGRHYCPAGAV